MATSGSCYQLVLLAASGDGYNIVLYLRARKEFREIMIIMDNRVYKYI